MSRDLDTSFEPFARHAFYRELNQDLVDQALGTADAALRPWKSRRVVDIACGTGAITRAVLDYWRRAGRRGEVFALDQSPVALERARRSVRSKSVQFVEGSANGLSTLVSAADVVLFCNAIHLVEDKACILLQVREALNKGGVFAFNSAFYDGSYAEGTNRFYRQWMVRALQIMRRKTPDIRTAKNNKAQAMQWLSKDEYCDLLAENGLKVVHLEERTIDVPLAGWIDISGYTDFAEGALPGIPLELAIPALRQAVREVFDETGVTTMARNWFQVVAQRA